MLAIAAGSLNKRVTLVKPSNEQNPLTGAAGADQPVGDVWAAIKPMSGSELYRAQQYNSEATIMVTIRFRKNVTADMTINYGQRKFYILVVLDELEQHVQLNLLCKEQQ